jgi:hypothetical protein
VRTLTAMFLFIASPIVSLVALGALYPRERWRSVRLNIRARPGEGTTMGLRLTTAF